MTHTSTEQPEALRLADELVEPIDGFQEPTMLEAAAAAELRRLHARIAELESQLEAIGAGGVEPLRKQAAAQQAVQAAYPHLPHSVADVVDFMDGRGVNVDFSHPAPAGGTSLYTAAQMRAYVDADRAEAAATQAVQAAVPEGWKLAPIKVPDSAFAWVSGGYPAGYKAGDKRDTAVVHERAQRTWEAILNGITAPAHPAEVVPAQAVKPGDALIEAVDKWFADNTGLGGCSDKDVAELAAIFAATQPAAQGMDALTPAARDVLAERKRQIETEGWKPERDDVYDTGEMALAAACYAAHSASCAAIKAPHTARGVFVRTRSAQDFVGEMWPWSADWWKPSGHRRNLEKAAALILAEIERIDRAALAAQAKQGGA